MTTRFNWPGATPACTPLIEKFERDLLPWLEKMGPWIGQAAMELDHPAAKEILLRHQGFQHGMPEARAYNFALLVKAMKAFQLDWEATKAVGAQAHPTVQ